MPIDTRCIVGTARDFVPFFTIRRVVLRGYAIVPQMRLAAQAVLLQLGKRI
jgi:hypothetical protein